VAWDEDLLAEGRIIVVEQAGLKRSTRFSQGWISGRLKMKSAADCQPTMVQKLSEIVT
jgi:hypothetical protein